MKDLSQSDIDFFYFHIMKAFESTQDGINYLFESGQISEKEFADLTIRNYKNCKKNSEDFAISRFGEDWKEKIQRLKESISKKRKRK